MAQYNVKHLVISKDGNKYNVVSQTYESKQAVSGGTDVSLVTTGEKYTWNNKIDTATANANFKQKQTAAQIAPSASGNDVSFIDALSQDANGVISATKKTVKTLQGATLNTNGAAGLVPAPSITDAQKFLAGDGTWKNVPISKPYVFELDMVNVSTAGAYSHDTTGLATTSTMKATNVECSNPDIFMGKITVTVKDGSITLACDSMEVGTSYVMVTVVEPGDAESGGAAIRSQEFDVLANRIAAKMDKAPGAAPGKYLQIDSDGDAVWGEAAAQTAVVAATEAWLDENVSGGETIAVDASLSISGAAADAKVTGGLRNALDAIEDSICKTISGEDIVTMTDAKSNAKVQILKIRIDPTQDLHGYKIPWAGGVGRQLIEPKMANAETSGVTCVNNGDGSFTLNCNPSTGNATFRIDQSTRNGTDNLKSYSAGNYTCSGLSDGVRLIVAKPDESFATLEFTDNGTVNLATDKTDCYIYLRVSSGVTLNNVTIKPMLEKGSTASTWQPWENICPIAGWTEMNVNRTGKNLFDGEIEEGSYNQTSGAKKVQEGRYRSANLVPVKPNTTYCFSVNGVATNINVLFYDRNKNFIPDTVYYGHTFTTVDNVFFITFFAESEINTNKNQIELGSTVTDYETYTGDKYKITFPLSAGTVYGGELMVNHDGTGTLTVDSESIASYAGETLPGEWISDRDVYNSGTTPTTGAQVVHKLVSAISYPLTDIEVISLLSGINVVWADTGIIKALTYRINLSLVDYVTPEMFGAAGDGITDDTNAVINCIKMSKNEVILNGDYRIRIVNDDEGTFCIGNSVSVHNKYIHGTGKIIIDSYENTLNSDPQSGDDIYNNIKGCPLIFKNSSNLIIEGITIQSTMDQIAAVQYGHSRRGNTLSSNVVGICVFGDEYPEDIATCKNIVFRDIKFIGCHIAFTFGGYSYNENILVDNCSYIDGGGMFIDCKKTRNLSITNCYYVQKEKCVGGMHFLYCNKTCDSIKINDCYISDYGWCSPAVLFWDNNNKGGGTIDIYNSKFVVSGISTICKAGTTRLNYYNCDITLIDRYVDAGPNQSTGEIDKDFSYVINYTNSNAVGLDPDIVNVFFNMINCKIRKDDSSEQVCVLTSHGTNDIVNSRTLVLIKNCIIENEVLVCRNKRMYCNLTIDSCSFYYLGYASKSFALVEYGAPKMKLYNNLFYSSGYIAPKSSGSEIIMSGNQINTEDFDETENILVPSDNYSGKFVLVNNLLHNIDTDFPEGLTNKTIIGNVEWHNT